MFQVVFSAWLGFFGVNPGVKKDDFRDNLPQDMRIFNVFCDIRGLIIPWLLVRIQPGPMTYDEDTSSVRSTISSKTEIDQDLLRLLEAWPTLPEPLKAGILAMIEAAQK